MYTVSEEQFMQDQNLDFISFVHRYQQALHRNLVYLASIADANQNIQALLPVRIF